jgi:hypothetical protein
MTIVESRPSALVRVTLDFEKPLRGTSVAEFNWSMIGEKGFVARAIRLTVGVERMIDEDGGRGGGPILLGRTCKRRPAPRARRPARSAQAPGFNRGSLTSVQSSTPSMLGTEAVVVVWVRPLLGENQTNSRGPAPFAPGASISGPLAPLSRRSALRARFASCFALRWSSLRRRSPRYTPGLF